MMRHETRAALDASKRLRTRYMSQSVHTRLRQHDPEWYEGPHYIDRFDETIPFRSTWREWVSGAAMVGSVIALVFLVGGLVYAILRLAAEG